MIPAFLAAPAPAAVLAALPGARAVGGAVRDHLAGKPIHDVDVAAPFAPEEIAARLRRAGLKVFETGLAHGTVTAVLPGEPPVEVTALRRDVATDGRHAAVAWTTDWAEDAARRDFTINAMSMGPDGALHDLFGGEADLRAGRVRFVGDAASRLREDYLRALRFFRFQARYGVGEPDGDAVRAIAEAVPGLARLSAERVWSEIKRILQAPDPRASLELMDSLGVLRADPVLPEATELPALRRLVALGAPPKVMLRLATLLTPGQAAVQSVAMRLHLSLAERQSLSARARRELSPQPEWTNPDSLRVFVFGNTDLMEQGREALLDIAWRAEARDGQDRRAVRAAANDVEWPVFPVLGRDVLALGVPTGVGVGRLLSDLKLWWLQETHCRASRDDLLQKLRELAPRPEA